MRFAVTAIIAAGLVSPAFAQDAAAPVAKPDAPAAQAKPVDPAAVAKAEGVLKDSAKAYAAAKALSDIITFAVKSPQGEQSQTMKVAMQGADQARINIEDMTFTAVGGSLYAEKAGIEERYAQFAIEGDIAATFESEIGFVPPHFVARSTDDVAKLIGAWTMEMLPDAHIVGYAAGADAHQITLAGEGGTGVLHINNKTMLMDKALMQMTPPGAPADFSMQVTLTYEPKVSDALDPALAFNAGTRQKVSSIEDLKIDLTGKPAPDFTLETLDGSKVTLSELKGNVVILDFWATWCGPCKMALPKLNEFAQWAKDNNQKVKVYGVDVWERTPADETKKAVAEFWTSKGYVMPTLLDIGDATAKKYGFDSIPTTIVVGPDGKIFTVHTGYNEDMVAELKKNVEDALAGKTN